MKKKDNDNLIDNSSDDEQTLNSDQQKTQDNYIPQLEIKDEGDIFGGTRKKGSIIQNIKDKCFGRGQTEETEEALLSSKKEVLTTTTTQKSKVSELVTNMVNRCKGGVGEDFVPVFASDNKKGYNKKNYQHNDDDVSNMLSMPQPMSKAYSSMFTKFFKLMLIPATYGLVYGSAKVMQLIHGKIYPDYSVDSVKPEKMVTSVDYSKCFSGKNLEVLKEISSGSKTINTKLPNGNPAIVDVVKGCLKYYEGQALVKDLLKKGADINSVSTDGKSLFMIALDNYSLIVAKMLVKDSIGGQQINWNYVNPNTNLSNMDYINREVTNEFNQSGVNLGKLEILLSLGLKADLIKVGTEPLLVYLAKQQVSDEIVSKVLEHTSNVNIAFEGKSAFMYALESQNFVTAYLFYKAGNIDMIYANDSGKTNGDYIKDLCNVEVKSYFATVIDCTPYEPSPLMENTLIDTPGHQEL